jgi:hypothetical protein
LNIFYNQLLSARMELNQHGLAGELNSAIVLRELTGKLPAMELERWLREKPDRPNCAKEFFLFVEKREAITAKVMAEMLAQAPMTAKGQESSKVKDSQDPRKMKAVAHAAVAAATNPAPAKPCPVPGCSTGHTLWRCWVFKDLPLNERGELVMKLKKCIFCLGDHDVAACDKQHWASCKTGACGKYHHRLLYGAVVNGQALSIRSSLAGGKKSMKDSQQAVMMLVQKAEVKGTSRKCLIYWDSGSSITLITN